MVKGDTRMKCPRCNGTGSVPYHIADDLFDETNCPLCGGSGENPNEVDRFNAVDFIKVMEMVKKPLTNEEWLCGLSTEEKAKFLRKIYRDGRDDYVGEWYEQTEKDFEEWLKQLTQSRC